LTQIIIYSKRKNKINCIPSGIDNTTSSSNNNNNRGYIDKNNNNRGQLQSLIAQVNLALQRRMSTSALRQHFSSSSGSCTTCHDE
jgi:hypothetical protein